MNELIVKNISKSYGNNIILESINLKFENGIYGLLGENGAGKTTLLEIICGVKKATTGTILFNNNIYHNTNSYRSNIGYLPQKFVVYPDYSAVNFLDYIAALKGIPHRERANKIEFLLKTLGLYDSRNTTLKKYSAGMLQRLGIAQSLLNDPKILVLDEPTSGLDPIERIHFKNIITSIKESSIIVLSTHIVSDVEDIADKIIFLNNGQITATGSYEKIVAPLKGYVWECPLNKASKNYIEPSQYKILKHSSDEDSIRFIAPDTYSNLFAKQVEPNLEDAFLYYKNNRQ